MLSRCIVVVALALGFSENNAVIATPTRVGRDKGTGFMEVSIDQLLSKNIALLQDFFLSTMEPFALNDYDVDFLDFHINQGRIKNLSSVEAIDHNTVTYRNKSLAIDLNLKWQDLRLRYTCHWKPLFGDNCDGVYKANLTDLKVSARLIADLNNYEILLDKIDVYEISDINAEIKVSTKHCDIWFINTITYFVKSIVISDIQDKARSVLNEYIQKINDFLNEHKNPTSSLKSSMKYLPW